MKRKSLALGFGLLLVAAILVWADRSERNRDKPPRELVSEVPNRSVKERPSPIPESDSSRAAKKSPVILAEKEEQPPPNPASEISEPKVAQVVDADAAFLEEVMKLPAEMRLLAVQHKAERRLKEYEKNNAKVLKEGVIDRGKLFAYVVPRPSSDEIKAMFAPFVKYGAMLTNGGDRMRVDQEMENFHRMVNPARGESKLLFALVSNARREVQYASISISNNENALEIMEEEIHPLPRAVGVPYTYRDGSRGLLKNASVLPWRMDHFVPKEDLVNIRHPHGKLR